MRGKPELLIPAGSPEALRAAIAYGADAVYLGGDMYGLREKARNFSPEEMREGIAYAHAYGRRAYVTANVTAHNRDLEGIRAYFGELLAVGPDAIILSDPGVFDLAREVCPTIDIHVSTQANNVNVGTFRFWSRMGARRAVAARELTLREIGEIRSGLPEGMEVEAFVHGAMCVSYSGRCLLSNYLTGRDANLGACTHPCRWKYYLMEETRPGEYFPVEENERGTYLLSSKDLCMVDHVPDLCAAGIDSLKVEGRMRTPLYVATVTRAYRRALDDYAASPALYAERIPWYLGEVGKCTHRQFTTGFFYGPPGQGAQDLESGAYVTEYSYMGSIQGRNGAGLYELEQRNKFSVGDRMEAMKPDGRDIPLTVRRIVDERGEDMESCPHPRQRIFVDFGDLGEELAPLDVLRRKAG